MSSTLNKSLEMLDIFLGKDYPLSAMDVANAMQMSRSNVHKYLAVLKDGHYLTYLPEEKKYTLGLKFFEFAKAVQKRLGLDRIALPFMYELYSQINALVVLSVPDNDKAYSVASVGYEQSDYKYTVRQGNCMPLYTGSLSLVLLAYHDDAYINKYIQTNELQKYTPFTVVAESILLRRIKTIREQGYFFTDHEVNPGGRSIAAPVFDCFGNIQASLGVVGTIHVLTDDKLDDYARLLMDNANKITACLAHEIDVPEIPDILKTGRL